MEAAEEQIDALYWFARGYYDGRAKGAEGEDVSDDHRYYYRRGYDVGVADYCHYDIMDSDR